MTMECQQLTFRYRIVGGGVSHKDVAYGYFCLFLDYNWDFSHAAHGQDA